MSPVSDRYSTPLSQSSTVQRGPATFWPLPSQSAGESFPLEWVRILPCLVIWNHFAHAGHSAKFPGLICPG